MKRNYVTLSSLEKVERVQLYVVLGGIYVRCVLYIIVNFDVFP